MKHTPKKVYIKEESHYIELSYEEFCSRKATDKTYADKLFLPVQGWNLLFRLIIPSFFHQRDRKAKGEHSPMKREKLKTPCFQGFQLSIWHP